MLKFIGLKALSKPLDIKQPHIDFVLDKKRNGIYYFKHKALKKCYLRLFCATVSNIYCLFNTIKKQFVH
jgi:hypothetical protein